MTPRDPKSRSQIVGECSLLPTLACLSTVPHSSPPPLRRKLLPMNKAIIGIVLLLAVAANAAGQTAAPYRVLQGDTDADGVPTTAARLCIGHGTTEHCYVPPTPKITGTTLPPFGLDAKARLVGTASGVSLIIFTAESSSGGSGSLTILALLDARDGRLQNLLPEVKVSNQSEYRFWNLPNVSAMPVLVTADFVWDFDKGETHFAHHRYRITSFVYDKQTGRYVQRDKFVTVKKYPGLDEVDELKVLEPEKAAIIARLKK